MNKAGTYTSKGKSGKSYSEYTPSFESLAAGNAGQGIRGVKVYSKGQEEYSLPKPNSKAQYNLEKAAGGANTDLSYEDWKNLD